MTPPDYDAVVVGSGPNGLTAAALLAGAGLSVLVLEAAHEPGGGARSGEMTEPGLIHDHCSAFYPFASLSPVFAALDLEAHGLQWRWPEVELAHPLDGGRAAALYRSIDDTVAGLGEGGRAWRRLFGPLAANAPTVVDEIFQPVLHLPRHPLTLAGFGVRALSPATLLARLLESEEAASLFGGCAAHALQPLSRLASAAVGVSLIAVGHHAGWPVAAGGAGAVTAALVRAVEAGGGRIETGVRVSSMDQLPSATVTLFDTSPAAACAIAGDRLPARVRRSLERFRHGPGVFKLDLAVQGGVPWTSEVCRRAGTVHLGGTPAEVDAAERAVRAGRMPERPFVLVGQQYLADTSRSVGDLHPVWAYAHVPHGYDGDATEAIFEQISRFAPGTRQRVVACVATPPAGLEKENPNCVGGDVAGGDSTLRQILFRPRPALDPYSLGAPGLYLCSSSTPPGGGVHGACGANAARRALAYARRA